MLVEWPEVVSGEICVGYQEKALGQAPQGRGGRPGSTRLFLGTVLCRARGWTP